MIEKKYTYFRNASGRPIHQWSAVDQRGGVHVWIEETGIADYPHMGGFEVHWRSPPAWAEGKPADKENCWLLKGPCWHDGSSLWASEYWIPRWLEDPHNHDSILDGLGWQLDKHFGDYNETKRYRPS